MTKEIWKPVVGYEGLYEVSNMGNVHGIRRSGCTGENLKGFVSKHGYHIVMLNRKCQYKHMPVHRLVAMAFIDNPENKRTVNHIDGNKLNNTVDNLEWATHGENHKHAYRIGLKKVTEAQREAARRTGRRTCALNRPRRPVICIDKDGNVLHFESAHAGARYVDGFPSPIVKCCKNKLKTYKGYEWRYDNGNQQQK